LAPGKHCVSKLANIGPSPVHSLPERDVVVDQLLRDPAEKFVGQILRKKTFSGTDVTTLKYFRQSFGEKYAFLFNILLVWAKIGS
jgi:hypothetical protein